MTRGLALLLLAAAAVADTVVLRDRTILEGSVTKGEKAMTVDGRTVPLEQVLLWEDKGGRALHAPSLQKHRVACEALAERRLLAACRERFPEALAAGAVDAARAMLDRAALLGLPAKEAAAWERQLAAASRSEGAPGAVPGADVYADVLVERARASLAAGEEQRGRQLLRAALRLEPNHKPALDLLHEIAPDFLRVGEDARGWLDWEVDVLRGEVRPLGRRAPDMERARATWRRDLSGLETREPGAEIVFLTPLADRTEVLGKCVRYAKITCRALAQMFATDQPRRDDNEPLVIYFYESRDEYLKNVGGSPLLAMSLGFYTAGENISRFFWPDRVDATHVVRRVFVHELTHHWIERRNPRWHAGDLAEGQARVEMPGYWVVEGFATFIEEGLYDIDAYRWSHFNPHAQSLGVVAALSREKEKKLIEWEKLFSLSQVEAQGEKLDKKGIRAVVRRKWAIAPQPFGEMRLFYEQSAAACHYLYWAEDGRYRARLLDYVTAHYTAQRAKTAIEAAFGLEPGELGARVEGFSRKVVDEGWRPSRK